MAALPDHRKTMATIVFWAVAVPLLLVAAWFFLEKQDMLPAFAQPAPTVQENAPAGDASQTDDSSQTGKSVDLPSDNNAKSTKPKKPGKRSQLIPLALPMPHQVSA